MRLDIDLNSFLEKRLEELVPDQGDLLSEAARYSLLNGGKRLRPLLVLGATETFGVNPLDALDPACAIELIHTYSLIHDDLPCMDNDDLRRGKPSLHKAYSESMALLAGDYLLTCAFEVLSTIKTIPTVVLIKLIRILSQRAGKQGMIGGQFLDIYSTGTQIDENRLFLMHAGKTGALFTACLEFGAILGDASPHFFPLLQEIGKELGIAYQYLDDLLNATSDSSTLGKTAGSDAANHKCTAVSLFGIKVLHQKLKELQLSLNKKLFSLPNEGEAIRYILKPLFQKFK